MCILKLEVKYLRIVEQYNQGDLPHLTPDMIVEIQTLNQNFQEVLDQLNQIPQNLEVT